MKRLAGRLWCLLVSPRRLDGAVLVYQMGKVGSSSIYTAVRHAVDRPVFHVHRMNPEHIRAVRQEHRQKGLRPPDDFDGLCLFHRAIKKARRLKIVTLVREPIARNISAYFENIQAFAGTRNINDISVERLVENFLESYPHRTPLEWFDNELRSTTGIDVYAHPFDTIEGWTILSEGPREVLILRSDLSDTQKKALLESFLGVDTVVLRQLNRGGQKSYAERYSAFLRRVTMPAWYVDEMLQSRYARHFFDRTTLEEARRRWQGERRE